MLQQTEALKCWLETTNMPIIDNIKLKQVISMVNFFKNCNIQNFSTYNILMIF